MANIDPSVECVCVCACWLTVHSCQLYSHASLTLHSWAESYNESSVVSRDSFQDARWPYIFTLVFISDVKLCCDWNMLGTHKHCSSRCIPDLHFSGKYQCLFAMKQKDRVNPTFLNVLGQSVISSRCHNTQLASYVFLSVHESRIIGLCSLLQ